MYRVHPCILNETNSHEYNSFLDKKNWMNVAVNNEEIQMMKSSFSSCHDFSIRPTIWCELNFNLDRGIQGWQQLDEFSSQRMMPLCEPLQSFFLTSFVILERISKRSNTWHKKEMESTSIPLFSFSTVVRQMPKCNPFAFSIFQIRLSSYSNERKTTQVTLTTAINHTLHNFGLIHLIMIFTFHKFDFISENEEKNTQKQLSLQKIILLFQLVNLKHHSMRFWQWEWTIAAHKWLHSFNMAKVFCPTYFSFTHEINAFRWCAVNCFMTVFPSLPTWNILKRIWCRKQINHMTNESLHSTQKCSKKSTYKSVWCNGNCMKNISKQTRVKDFRKLKSQRKMQWNSTG